MRSFGLLLIVFALAACSGSLERTRADAGLGAPVDDAAGPRDARAVDDGPSRPDSDETTAAADSQPAAADSQPAPASDMAAAPTADASVDTLDPNMTADGCFKWRGAQLSGSLQAAVNAHGCVEVQAGTFVLDAPVHIAPGHTLRGVGAAQSTLRADRAKWQLSCCDSLIADTLPSDPTKSPFSVSKLTVDGANVATYGVCCRGFTASELVITSTRCSAIGAAGRGVVVRKSTLTDTAWPTAVPGRGTISCATGGFGGVAEGAAIYSESDGARLDPVFEDNTIRRSYGPALDINGTWGGVFRRNTVIDNTGWAAVSLYGASYWTIADNTVRHPSDQPPQPYHAYCRGGPAGARSAAIFICQDTDTKGRIANHNVVERNKASSFYGILAVGADELKPYWAPRLNTFRDNDVTGSNFGCADDFKPGQWQSGEDNVWSNNNCAGSPNTSPGYF
ncbi:MAG: right-handed parallel beta-helix repeat-containing protein [Myxococcales bacterium]|nr:right-handed parallel beta-helix repeat-containing protein [Myxococcales bacterium]